MSTDTLPEPTEAPAEKTARPLNPGNPEFSEMARRLIDALAAKLVKPADKISFGARPGPKRSLEVTIRGRVTYVQFAQLLYAARTGRWDVVADRTLNKLFRKETIPLTFEYADVQAAILRHLERLWRDGLCGDLNEIYEIAKDIEPRSQAGARIELITTALAEILQRITCPTQK